jgi:hypothetical protein
MKVPGESGATGELAARYSNMSGLDTVDACRMRLLALRTRIETNRPTPSRRLFTHGQVMDRRTRTAIAELLQGLPTPLPFHPDPLPELIMRHTDLDLGAVPGRDSGLTGSGDQFATPPPQPDRASSVPRI